MRPLHAFATRSRKARDAIAAASVAGLDARELLTRAARELAAAVPHDAAGWCVTDPGTLLWTGGIVQGMPEEVTRGFYDNELLRPDVLKFRDLARARTPVGVLSHATGGDLAASDRHRTMYAPHGLEDELRVAFVADGACFGTACLLRARGAAPFTAQEVAFVEAVSRHVAHGLRSALVTRGATGPGGAAADPGAGVLVLGDDLEVLSATRAAEDWLDQLGAAADGVPLPAAVVSVVRRARALAEGADADGPPRTRLRVPGGRWLAVHASALGPRPGPWAVVLEPARPAEVLPLLARAHELTPREHEVFGLLLRGVPDKLIALELAISGHTAREHVRRVQQKLGVHSRGELQALMHETQYDPWIVADAA